MNKIDFESYGDPVSADSLVTLLTEQGVPAVREDRTSSFVVVVPESLLHRARWVLSQSDFDDSELSFLATGKLDDDESE